MSRQQGGSGDVVRGAGSAAAKGALLIGLAVVIGIVLLQTIDTGDSGSNGSSGNGATTSTTTDTTEPGGSTTSTTAQAAPKEPAQLKVIVLNGGAAAGEAGRTSDAIRLVGYTNQDTANTWSGHTQTGDTVHCMPGLDREAAALAVSVGEGATVAAWPDPAPPFTEGVDCVVVVGA
jgi:hypothetical protein